MNENEIKEYLTDVYNRELPDMTARSIHISKSNKIVSIIGPRRAGKTYLMFQKMKELIQQGVRRDSIIYLNFEDARRNSAFIRPF